MKLGFNGATTMKADLPTDIRVAAQAGFDVLEIWGAKMDEYLKARSVQDLKRLIAAGIPAETINSIENATLQDDAGFRKVRLRCRTWSEIASQLGVKSIIIVPSPSRPGMKWPEVRDRSVASLGALAEVARPFGVRLAFEFLGFSWCSVNRLDQCLEIVKAVDRDDVGMVLDACHYHAGGSTPEMIRTADPEKIFIVHLDDVEDRPKAQIQDCHRIFPGRGVLPLGRLFTELKSIGYGGPVSVELFRPEYWDWDPERTAAEAYRAAREVLAPFA